MSNKELVSSVASGRPEGRPPLKPKKGAASQCCRQGATRCRIQYCSIEYKGSLILIAFLASIASPTPRVRVARWQTAAGCARAHSPAVNQQGSLTLTRLHRPRPTPYSTTPNSHTTSCFVLTTTTSEIRIKSQSKQHSAQHGSLWKGKYAHQSPGTISDFDSLTLPSSLATTEVEQQDPCC